MSTDGERVDNHTSYFSLTKPLVASEWQFLAEGSAHVVLRYCGRNPKLAFKILRLRKVDNLHLACHKDNIVERLQVTDKLLWSCHSRLSSTKVTSAEFSEEYVDSILRPLVGDNLTYPSDSINIDVDFLSATAFAIAPMRDLCRVRNSEIDFQAKFAVLHQNHNLFPGSSALRAACRPTFSVELKPKSCLANTADCFGNLRFQLHQAIKVSTGRERRFSRYDPAGLFFGTTSGERPRESRFMWQGVVACRIRLRRTLLSLVADPQNNFCVRRDDNKKYLPLETYPPPDTCESKSESARNYFVKVGSVLQLSSLAQLLRLDFCPLVLGVERFSKEAATIDCFLNVLITALEHSEVLSRVTALQRMDRIGVQLANVLAAKLIRHLLTGNERSPGELKAKNVFDRKSGTVSSQQLLRDLIVSRTATDCSVIIALQPQQYSGLPFLSQGEMLLNIRGPRKQAESREKVIRDCHIYRCHTAVVDLDMKSIFKLQEWLVQDTEIRANYNVRARSSASRY